MLTQLETATPKAKTHHTPSVYLSDSQIGLRYGVSRQTVWRWAATDCTFPAPIKLSPGCTRWKLSDIEAWEAAK